MLGLVMRGEVVAAERPGWAGFAGRLRSIREDRFGEDGIPALARMIGVPERTWQNYEVGATVPGEVVLRFLDATSAEPRWLLTGQGPRYRPMPQAAKAR